MTAPVPVKAVRPTTAPSSLNTRVLGGLLLVFGTGWMLKETGVIDMPWAAVVSIVLIALGLALLVTARSRARTVPLIVLGAVLTAGLAIGSSDIRFRGGIGERSFTPLTLATVDSRYALGIGDLTLDLRRVDFPAGTRIIRADVSVGRLQVRVPAGVGVRVNVDAKFGSATVMGERQDVRGKASDTFETEGYDNAETRLHLILHVGVGQIDVE